MEFRCFFGEIALPAAAGRMGRDTRQLPQFRGGRDAVARIVLMPTGISPPRRPNMEQGQYLQENPHPL